MVQRLGLVHATKSFVMDIHTEGTKDKRHFGKQNAMLVTMEPDRREAHTTDALRECVRETSMPLVVQHPVQLKDTPETTKPNVAGRFLFSR